MILCPGYEIVCPDGYVRHGRFQTSDGAALDARFYGERRNCCVYEHPHRYGPPCPQGEHTVRPVTFTRTQLHDSTVST